MSMQLVGTRAGSKGLPAGMVVAGGRDRLLANGAVVQQGRSNLSGLGMTAQEIADLIKETSAATLPILVSQNPGTRYETRADGSIVIYSQPTGTQATLPGGFTTAGNPYVPGASGQVQVGSTQASFAGFDTTTLLVGGLALFAIVMMVRK